MITEIDLTEAPKPRKPHKRTKVPSGWFKPSQIEKQGLKPGDAVKCSTHLYGSPREEQYIHSGVIGDDLKPVVFFGGAPLRCRVLFLKKCEENLTAQ